MKHFDSFALDMSNECLWHNGEQVTLPPKPFAVLRHLVENAGRLVTQDELLDALWPETYVQPQVLRTYILDLRKALGDDARQPRFIQSLHKRGYRFVAPVREQSTAASTPIPETRSCGIVGRATEMDLLNRHIRRALTIERQVVIVTGDSGIGKTALVSAFSRQLDPSLCVTVAGGHCVQGFSRSEPYYPVMEALAQLCAAPEGERASKILARLAPAWVAALGREPERPQTVFEERRSNQLCMALEALSSEKPLLLVFDDLHWADESTLNLISALARRTAPARLMVLATCSPRCVPPEHWFKRVKQDLLVHNLCSEVALGPLGKSHVTELLRGALSQHDLPLGLDHFVHEHSEGNPLFAIAILEHLIAQRFLVTEGPAESSRWRQRIPFQQMEAGVPDRLAQMIELEIGDLNTREQRVLEAASLFPVAFPAWAVAAALETELTQAEEECEALAHRLHYIRRGGQDELPDGTFSAFYVFAHGMYREVLYQRQPAARRARGHARVAERLGEIFSGREMDVAREMAMHQEAAGNWLRAADTLRAAARHAQGRKAFGIAEDLMKHALRISENLAGSARQSITNAILEDLASLRPVLAVASPDTQAQHQKA